MRTLLKTQTRFALLLSLIFSLTIFLSSVDGYSQQTECTGCDRSYSLNTGTVTVNPADTVCLTAPNFTGNIIINGGILKICGTATPAGIAFNNGSNQVFIINNNSLTLNNYNANPNVVLVNNSILRIRSSVNLDGSLVNYQYAEVTGDINVNSRGSLNNFGFLQVSGNITNNNQVVNEGGTLDVRGSVINNSTGYFVNKGSLYIGRDLTNLGSLINGAGATLRVAGLTQINSNGILYAGEGSLLTTTNLTVDGIIEGTAASCASIRVSNRTIINSQAVIRGLVEICDANGVEVRNGTIIAPARIGCTCTPSTSGKFAASEEFTEEKGILAYPSPFTNSLSIEYTLKENATVSLSLYNGAGVKVKEIIAGEAQAAGDHKADLNAEGLPGGVYIYVLQAGTEYRTGKVIKK